MKVYSDHELSNCLTPCETLMRETAAFLKAARYADYETDEQGMRLALRAERLLQHIDKAD